MATVAALARLTEMAMGLPRYLARPLTVDEAREELRRRMATREERFLLSARLLIFASPESPYARLLAWAGIGEGDLRTLVLGEGLDDALRRLRDVGVRVTMEQLKGIAPIVRNGLTIEPSEADFDAPVHGGLLSSSSGTRSTATRVAWDWPLIAEHASNELMLHFMHGFLHRPLALWLPAPPGLAGMHFALLRCKARHPITRWYSHVSPGEAGSKVLGRRGLALGTAYIRACSALFGAPIPKPQVVHASEPEVIARWMGASCAAGSPPILRSYVSSALRVIRAARELGLDLTGSVALTGGEPLTEARRQFFTAAGVLAVPRYSASEAGLIGAACPNAATADDMHVYVDRLAVIGEAESEDAADTATGLLFTSLSSHAGKVLLNADIGDEGILDERRCECELGQLGMGTRVREVRSNQKLTAGGMAIPLASLESIVTAEIVRRGGAPTDVQICQVEEAGGESIVEIIVSPRVEVDERQFLDAVAAGLGAGPAGGELAALLWSDGNLLRVVRAEPTITRGHKQPLTIRRADGA